MVEPPEPRARGGGRRRTVGDIKDVSKFSELSENAGEGFPPSGDERIERIIASLGLLASVAFESVESERRRGGRGEGRVGFGEERGDVSGDAIGEGTIGVKLPGGSGVTERALSPELDGTHSSSKYI